mmetsp:Transcript_121785/g.191156  ORF Transcript_121785/g.191156 Transcript_121785/m.191156 type:complete len:82 (-) Transcript_121785:5-250(-)
MTQTATTPTDNGNTFKNSGGGSPYSRSIFRCIAPSLDARPWFAYFISTDQEVQRENTPSSLQGKSQGWQLEELRYRKQLLF